MLPKVPIHHEGFESNLDDAQGGDNASQPNLPLADGVGLLPLFSEDTGVTFESPQAADAGTAGTLTSSSTPTITGNASGFVINVNYDANVASAPAGFTSTISSVVQYLESVITSPMTVNIQVGYGEINGQLLGSGALGSSQTFLSSFSYNSIKNALSSIDPSAASSLPSAAPGTMWISTAEAKALGLSGASSNVDGYAGFSSSANIFDYDKSNGISAGQYDFFGTVAHEFTEIMGRIDLFGVNIGGMLNSYDLLDMYHYTSPGVHTYTGSTTNYFSVDGGTTNIHNFNTNSNGDLGDWASGSNDAFNAFSNSGIVNAISSGDITELNAIGYTIAAPTTVIESAGSTSLVQIGNNYFLYPIGGSAGPELQYGGANVVAGQFGGWTPIGAEQTASGYEVAWKDQGSGSYVLWNTDSNGAYLSNSAALAGASNALESAELTFHQDLNSDGTIGVPAPPTQTVDLTLLRNYMAAGLGGSNDSYSGTSFLDSPANSSSHSEFLVSPQHT